MAAGLLVRDELAAGQPARFRVWADLLDDLRAAEGRGDGVAAFRRVVDRAGLLVLDDDVGAARATQWASDRLLALVDSRPRHEQPLLLTINLPASRWHELGDERIAARPAGGLLVRAKPAELVVAEGHHVMIPGTPLRAGWMQCPSCGRPQPLEVQKKERPGKTCHPCAPSACRRATPEDGIVLGKTPSWILEEGWTLAPVGSCPHCGHRLGSATVAPASRVAAAEALCAVRTCPGCGAAVPLFRALDPEDTRASQLQQRLMRAERELAPREAEEKKRRERLEALGADVVEALKARGIDLEALAGDGGAR